MRFQTRSRHIIDLIFPIALFFVFAASSLAVLILAANLYNSTTSQTQINDENRTSLSYITQKVRQNDDAGNITIASIEGVDCLTLSSDYNASRYNTYIYVLDGKLKELFVKEGISVSLQSGKDIMDISSIQMKELQNHLFRFTSTDKNGKKESVILSERSVQ